MSQPPSHLKRTFGPVPTLKELNVACWACLLAFIVIPTGFVVSQRQLRGQFLQSLGADFIYFYSMGRIVNEQPAERLYDYALQQRVCSDIRPLAKGSYGRIPYHPYVGVVLQPFARMTYASAYLLWVAISFALYIAGVVLVSRRCFPDEPVIRSLLLCLSLAFYPFIGWVIMSGQFSAVGFFAISIAFYLEDIGLPIQGGVALSLCLYKPTLLVFIIPMLLLTRRVRILAGFSAGGLLLALLPTAVLGPGVWKGYLGMLLDSGGGAVNSTTFRDLSKYVDLAAVARSVSGQPARLAAAILLGAAALAALFQFRLWWNSRNLGRAARAYAWSAAITWTLVLNVYTPIYDTILVVIAVIATAGALNEDRGRPLRGWFIALSVAVFVAAWVTIDIAVATRFQLITALFAAMGLVQMALLRGEIRATAESDIHRAQTVI